MKSLSPLRKPVFTSAVSRFVPVCGFVVLLVVTSLPANKVAAQENANSLDTQMFQMLDGNRDGQLDPYEALDVLLQVQQELNGGKLTTEKIKSAMKERSEEEQAEVAEMLKEMDANGDGKTTLDELDDEARGFAQMMDKNEDGTISIQEATDFEMDDEVFMSPQDIRHEVNHIFEECDEDKDGFLTKDEAKDDDLSWEKMSEGDSDKNGKVSKHELTVFMTADNQRARFKVNGDTAVMSGVINADTPATVLRLVHEHPSVRTIEMTVVPGSIDDQANLRAALYIRKFGFTTIVRSNGTIASGGTDFFLAGKKRIVEKGAKLGIHSWGGPVDGDKVPKDDPQHDLYLDYYKEIGIPVAFYWRTLEAAPANDIHWMTEKELETFHVRTGEVDSGAAKRKSAKPEDPSGDK